MINGMHRGPWAMEFGAWRELRDFVAKVDMGAARTGVRSVLGVEIDGDTATIAVEGALMRVKPWWIDEYGIPATSYVELAEAIRAAATQKGVERIHLQIESPGGEVAGLENVVDAIAEARRYRTVTAHTDSLCASAAYWIASQCETVTVGPAAMIGSIGVYTILDDTSRAWAEMGVDVHIVRSGPHKGVGADGVKILPENLAKEQELIDAIAGRFVDAVKRGRPGVGDPASWATGEVWLGADAVRVGLADKRRGGKAAKKGGSAMSDPVTPKSVDDLIAEAVERGRAEERARLAALANAFGGEHAFVLDQAMKGLDVTAAKAAFADVLIARNQALVGENAELRCAVQAREEAAARESAGSSAGTQPIGNDGSAGEPVDVRGLHDSLVDGGMRTDDAWRKVIKDHPADYATWRASGGK